MAKSVAKRKKPVGKVEMSMRWWQRVGKKMKYMPIEYIIKSAFMAGYKQGRAARFNYIDRDHTRSMEDA